MDDSLVNVLAVTGFFVVFAGILAGVIALMIHLHRKEHRSRREVEALGELVRQRGWAYQESAPGWADRFSGGEPFPTVGKNLGVADLVTGSHRGQTFCCFERRISHVTVDDGRRRRNTDYFRVFAIQTPAERSRLQIKRAGFGSKVLEAVGFDDLELGDAEFDEAFRVKTDDEAFARRVLTTYTMRWLLADPRAKEQPFRFERDELVTWERARLTAESIEPTLDYLCDVLEQVPAEAWR